MTHRRSGPGAASYPRRLTAWAAAGALAVTLVSCTASPDRRAEPDPDGTGGAGGSDGTGGRPNIVFVLTDDLSWNLVSHMPNVQRMQQRGLTFSRYFVTDSLCCPSRATTFTGRFPHNTGVITNEGDDGGYETFNKRGNHRNTFATTLRVAGYRTAMMGKYLNGYTPRDPVPPGWSEWYVGGNAYRQYDYTLNENGRPVRYGDKPDDYLTDVLARKGVDFIKRAAEDRRPFMMEISTFAPHGPFTPALRDKNKFPGLRAPRGPAFNEADVSDKPDWLKDRPRLGRQQINRIDATFRKRARSVQAVDKMIGDLQKALAANGADRDTYFVFASDNGFHMGEHRLTNGKQTAFDTDINVPLIVTGPGVAAGRRTDRLVQNTDLRPTFDELGGAEVPDSVDGRSLVPMLKGKDAQDWRDAVLVEHRGPNREPGDPDRPAPGGGNPPSYKALRTTNELYVAYEDGRREYYNLRRDPHALDNSVRRASSGRLSSLKSTLDRLGRCAGRDCHK